MSDELRSDNGLGGLDGQLRRTPKRPEADLREHREQRPVVDREVPYDQEEQNARVLSPLVHAWLDGELPEASVRKGDTARDVEFWKQVNGEVERRRHMKTPAYLEAQIMNALPQTAPSVINKWWQREFVISPTTAAVAAAGLIVAAAAVTAVVMAFAR